MQIEVKNLPKSEFLITVEVDPESLVKYEEQASARISENVEIPGFRKGQAPKAFVIAHVGPQAFFQEVLNVALPRTYFDAIKEKKLAVISRPDVKVISQSPLKYEARVGVMPQIEMKGLENLKMPVGKVEVTDTELELIVEEMRRYRATFKSLERPVQRGDRIEIDFQGFDEGGAALEKTKSANHPLFVGEGSLVPGFEEELVGMKTGEKKKFPLKFPKDYDFEQLRGKTVHFEVELKRAEETILPALDETFVEQVMGQKKTVPEFHEAIRKDLHMRKSLEERKKCENELLEKLLKEAKFDVPPSLLEEEIDAMMDELQREVEARGLKFETFLEKLNAEKKRDLRKEHEPEAEKRIRIRLILHHLFTALGIEASEEEVKKSFEQFLVTVPEKERAAVQQNFDKKGEMYIRLKNNIMVAKVFSRYLD